MTDSAQLGRERIDALLNDPDFVTFVKSAHDIIQNIWDEISNDADKWRAFYEDPCAELRTHGLLGHRHPVLDEDGMKSAFQDIMKGPRLDDNSRECRHCHWWILGLILVLLGIATAIGIILAEVDVEAIVAGIEAIVENPIPPAQKAALLGASITAAVTLICKDWLHKC